MKSIYLNSIQYRFWIDNSLRSDNTYNVAYSFKFSKNLNIDFLKEALHCLMMEYEPFHSVIMPNNMNPIFIVRDSFKVPFYIEKITESRDSAISARIDELASVEFNLEKEFPCRFYLLATEDHYYFLTLFHHIVMDGLTMFDFCNRLSQLYNILYDNGSIEPLKSELVSFNDFWKCNYTKQQKVDDVDYWSCYLKNVPLHTTLPEIKDSGVIGNETYFFSLGNELFNKSEVFRKKEKTTLFRLYSSVWMVILNYFLQMDDVLLDHTIHLRPKEYSELLGSYVNNLPIHANFRELHTFRDLLEYSRNNRHEERNHQKASYTDIISELRRKQELSETEELFNIGIDYPIRNHSLTFCFNGCKGIFYRQSLANLVGDLCLVIEDDELFSCSIRYKKSLSVTFIKQLAQAFRLVLEQVFDNVDIPLQEINFLSADTRKHVLAQSESSLHLSPSDDGLLPVTEILSLVAEKEGLKSAVCCNSKTLSFDELNRKSTIVAMSLLLKGFKGTRVGLAMLRDINMVISIFGVLKSGSAYVPLDLANPFKRLKDIIDDCGISVIITDNPNVIGFPNVLTIHINELLYLSASKNECELPKININDTAYIIYTSGTTGKPKGIPITHCNLSNMVYNEKSLFDITERSIVLQFANISFDASVTEIFTTICQGATLVIADEIHQKDFELLIKLLKEEHINCATIPPALLSVLPYNSFPELKTLIVGGESTPAETIALWRKGRKLINAYGPTENTVDTSMCVMDDSTPANDIGMSLAGVSCYILDKSMRLLPPDVVGELYIGGRQLTRGYINRPDLNAEVFIPNPYVSEKDKAEGINLYLYKSGDLVRRISNGHLLYLGRSDFQVKIRGMRIELSEIESCLNDNPIVRHSLVTLHKYNDVEQLVAYVVIENKNDNVISELKDYLAHCLPSYMIPSYWCFIDSFPLNVNGKIDKDKLPIPKMEVANRKDNKQILPKTVAETILVNIVSSILEVEDLSPEDDLFDLGLTSIQTMEAVFDAASQGVRTSVYKFFKLRTIREIVKDNKSLYCYWGNEYSEDKPLLIIVCGYPYFSYIYTDFFDVLKEKYSILVLESFNEYFLKKEECSLSILLDLYVKLLKPILKDKSLFGVTGYCLGGEIALQLAVRLKEEQIASPKVFVIDGYADRTEKYEYSFVEEPGVDMEVNIERNRISNALCNSFFFKQYDGEVNVCLSKKFIKVGFDNPNSKISDNENIDNGDVAYVRFMNNEKIWRQKLPSCHIYSIDSNHMNILSHDTSLQLLSIMDSGRFPSK